MDTLRRQFKIAVYWMLSFLRRDRLPEHYPIEVRQQSGVPVDSEWCARVLNWPGLCGLGPTAVAARAALKQNLQGMVAYRRANGEVMPRPGSRVPITFASAERVSQDPDLLSEFIVKALGFGPENPVFISDMTSIEDFGDEEEVEEIRSRILENFGVTVDEQGPTLVVDVLIRIRAAR